MYVHVAILSVVKGGNNIHETNVEKIKIFHFFVVNCREYICYLLY